MRRRQNADRDTGQRAADLLAATIAEGAPAAGQTAGLQTGPGTTQGAAQPIAPLAVSELSQVTEEARVYVALGHPERAINVLRQHINALPRAIPAAWLMLLELYHANDRPKEFAELADEFHGQFNVQTPKWEGFTSGTGGDDGLDTFPHIAERIAGLWRQPGCRGYLEQLLYDNRDGRRLGFPLAAYSDILMLLQVLDQVGVAAEEPQSHESANRARPPTPTPPAVRPTAPAVVTPAAGVSRGAAPTRPTMVTPPQTITPQGPVAASRTITPAKPSVVAVPQTITPAKPAPAPRPITPTRPAPAQPRPIAPVKPATAQPRVIAPTTPPSAAPAQTTPPATPPSAAEIPPLVERPRTLRPMPPEHPPQKPIEFELDLDKMEPRKPGTKPPK